MTKCTALAHSNRLYHIWLCSPKDIVYILHKPRETVIVLMGMGWGSVSPQNVYLTTAYERMMFSTVFLVKSIHQFIIPRFSYKMATDMAVKYIWPIVSHQLISQSFFDVDKKKLSVNYTWYRRRKYLFIHLVFDNALLCCQEIMYDQPRGMENT